MAKKLTISIPDNLHEKLSHYRDRIAISSVCSEAIRKEIEKIRKYGLEAKKRFKLLNLKEAMDVAYERGLKWSAEEATLEEIAYICLDSNQIDEELAKELWDCSDTLLELNSRYGGFDDLISERGFVEDLLPAVSSNPYEEVEEPKIDKFWTELVFSFQDGVVNVWKEIEKEATAKLLGKIDSFYK